MKFMVFETLKNNRKVYIIGDMSKLVNDKSYRDKLYDTDSSMIVRGVCQFQEKCIPCKGMSLL